MAGVFRKVYSFIRKDFWRKMIALFFALMIYAVVQDLQQDGRTVTDVPVEVVLPPELVSIGAPEFRVTVRRKGRRGGLRRSIRTTCGRGYGCAIRISSPASRARCG